LEKVEDRASRKCFTRLIRGFKSECLLPPTGASRVVPHWKPGEEGVGEKARLPGEKARVHGEFGSK